jgi:hypothetical protein
MATLISACGTTPYNQTHLYGPIEKFKEDLADHGLRPLTNLSKKQVFYWDYAGQRFMLELMADQQLNAEYKKAKQSFELKKILTNQFEDYLTRLPGDTAVSSIARQLKSQAELHGFNDSQLAALAVSFVQSLPYDIDEWKELKSDDGQYINKRSLQIYKTPYQVICQRKGVCLDKSLLGIDLLRELGFGAALIDLEKNEHTAFAIQCEPLYGFGPDSNYRYIEPTGRLNIGVVPLIMKGKQVQEMKIALATEGKIYYGSQVKNLIP